jgi:hypothetical protein
MIISLGLNRALKWRPRQVPHNKVEEFRTTVNEGRRGYAAKRQSNSAKSNDVSSASIRPMWAPGQITLTDEYNPQLRLMSNVTVQNSIVGGANGSWRITSLAHDPSTGPTGFGSRMCRKIPPRAQEWKDTKSLRASASWMLSNGVLELPDQRFRQTGAAHTWRSPSSRARRSLQICQPFVRGPPPFAPLMRAAFAFSSDLTEPSATTAGFFLDVFMFLFEPVNDLLATNILRRFHIRPVVVCEAVRSRSEALSWVRLSI